MYRLLSSTVAALSAMTILLGCGGDKSMSPEDLAPDTFEAQVSGAINLSFQGMASFSNQIGYFQLALLPAQANASNGLITLVRADAGIPATGSYQVSEEAGSNFSLGFIGLFAYTAGQAGETYISQSGTCTITSSGTDHLKGSFNFTATSDAKTVTVSGQFHATSSPF